jgi:hypothetical protein
MLSALVLAQILTQERKNPLKNLWVFSSVRVWGMGYHILMGYGIEIPAHQHRRLAFYGVSGVMGY